MVIRNLAVIKNSFALGQWFAFQRCYDITVVLKTTQNLGTLIIDVMSEEAGINSWVSSYLLLIQALHRSKCFISAVTVFLVTVNLQGCEVIELGTEFLPFRFLNTIDLQLIRLCYSKMPLCFKVVLKLTVSCLDTAIILSKAGEGDTTIYRLQNPVRLRTEISYLPVSVDNDGESGSLDTTY